MATPHGSRGFALARWLDEHALDLLGPHAWQGGQKWIFPICPWNPEHTNKSAYIIQHARGEAVGQAIARLQQVAVQAVDTLKTVMDDPATPAPAKVSAAKIVLDLALRGREVEDLEARVTALEHQQENS